MLPMKALIVDDEKFCRENLKVLLKDYCPEVKEIEMASGGEEARSTLSNWFPDILFLDIKMPKEDGFDLLQTLDQKPKSVIFTTAHDEFALKAIKAEALDYLEKPINIDDLQQAVEKAAARSESKSDKEEIVQLISEELSKKERDDRIAIPMREGFELIAVKDIIHLEASESYTLIYLSDRRRIVSSKNIKVYETKLSDDVFFRTHKSHIINVKYHLKSFNRIDGNSAVMSDGKHVPISRRKLQSFLEEIVGTSEE